MRHVVNSPDRRRTCNFKGNFCAHFGFNGAVGVLSKRQKRFPFSAAWLTATASLLVVLHTGHTRQFPPTLQALVTDDRTAATPAVEVATIHLPVTAPIECRSRRETATSEREHDGS